MEHVPPASPPRKPPPRPRDKKAWPLPMMCGFVSAEQYHDYMREVSRRNRERHKQDQSLLRYRGRQKTFTAEIWEALP